MTFPVIVLPVHLLLPELCDETEDGARAGGIASRDSSMIQANRSLQ
jgi:hypothetical protein